MAIVMGKGYPPHVPRKERLFPPHVSKHRGLYKPYFDERSIYVAHDDRHLITEQLSVALDGQLAAAEQAQLDAHLSTCEQCQQRLAALRHTVALLRALPQPVLPRSFELPIPLHETATAEVVETPKGAATQSQSALTTAEREPVSITAYRAEPATIAAHASRRSRRANPLRTALRTMSALAAVAGLFLLLSGMFAVSNFAVTTSAPGMQASQSSSALPHTNDASTPPVPGTPTPIVEQRVAQATQVANLQATATSSAQPATSSPPVVESFLDLSTVAGRVSVGFLLLLLGLIGIIVFRKRRYRQEMQL